MHEGDLGQRNVAKAAGFKTGCFNCFKTTCFNCFKTTCFN